jgi:DNA-binding response OmpR family regulator
MKILLAEDDLDLSSALSSYLASLGWDVVCCADGAEALALARKNTFDVLLLDLSLPSLDGLEVLQRLRSGDSATPVLVITARGNVAERVTGLEAGADDYLSKPFDLSELVARLKALTRRFGKEGQLRCGLIRYEPAGGTFYRNEIAMDISPRESLLLKSLMTRIDRVIPKEELLSSVFGNEPALPEALDVIVHRLRKKLNSTGAEVVNLRGIGYLLRDDLFASRSDA